MVSKKYLKHNRTEAGTVQLSKPEDGSLSYHLPMRPFPALQFETLTSTTLIMWVGMVGGEPFRLLHVLLAMCIILWLVEMYLHHPSLLRDYVHQE